MLSFLLSVFETEEDRSKLEELFCRYGSLMYHIAYQKTQNHEQSEDAVQDAILKLDNYLDRIGEIDCHKTRAFIVIIVRSVVRDMCRKENARTAAYLEDYGDFKERLMAKSDPGFDILKENIVAENLEQLSEKYRHPLLLRYYLGFSEKDISKILNISYAAARKRIERAREQLKLLLESDGRYRR